MENKKNNNIKNSNNELKSDNIKNNITDNEKNNILNNNDNTIIKLTKKELKKIKKLKKTKNFNLHNAIRYNSDYKKGLNTNEVNERITNGYINYYESNTTKTYRNIFFSNIFTFFNLLCFLIAIALILVGSFNNLFFMFIF